jgi:hypothetical protein
MTRLALSTVLLCSIAFGPSTLPAQRHSLIVSVADAVTGKPLEGAQVRLPDIGRAGRADWIGEVRIRDVSAGLHRVQVRMVGYAPSEITVRVEGDSTGAVFMLEQTAAQADTVKIIEHENVPAKLFEFEAHKKMGIARILQDTALERVTPDRLSLTLATRFPGLALEILRDGHTTVKSLRQSGDIWNSKCSVAMYLDGQKMGQDQYETLDPKLLAGVEYYPMNMAPAQYRFAPGSVKGDSAISCVVLLFWSK